MIADATVSRLASRLLGGDLRPLGRLFGFGFVLMLVANAFNLFSYPFSIDAELGTFSFNPADFVASGRWAAFLLSKYFMPYAGIPVVPILIACATFSAAYALVARLWDEAIGWPHYLAAPVALCHPLLFQLLAFSVVSYAVGIAVLMTALALHLLARPSPSRFAASVPLFAFAFGVYQPVALYPCVAFLAALGLGLTRRGLSATVRLALVVGAAAGLAALLNAAVTEAAYRAFKVTTFYTDSFYDVDYLGHHPLRALRDTLLFAVPIVSGVGGPFITTCAVYTATIAAAAGLAVAARLAARRGAPDLVLSVALIGGAVLVSVLPCVLTRGSLPYRTLLGTPVALAGVVFCAGQIRLRAARLALGALAGLSFLAFAQIGSRLHYSNYLAWLNDRALGQSILDRIDALPDLPAGRPVPIDFVGYHDWPRSEQIIDVGADSIMGTSFFAWDGGSPDRILAFLKTLGRFDLVVATSGEREAVRPIVEAMPAWPRPGSVRLVDGIVAVRLGPTPR